MASSRYHRFSDHLRQKFGCRVHKIALDAGLSCPNRDGTISRQGCLYCDPAGGSGRKTERAAVPVSQQMRDAMAGLRRRYGAEKFIAYFQSFTNTYGPIAKLKAIYDEAVGFEDVVGLSIATRPDCLGRKILSLIASYVTAYDTWVELGVQSMHEESLEAIERGHGVAAIESAVRMLKQHHIQVCAHLIVGLPGEGLQDMTATAKRISDLGVDAVKFHMLYVTRTSRLAEVLKQGRLRLFTREEYVKTVAHLLGHLAPHILIQRLVSEAHPDLLLAPEWLKHKSSVIRDIEQELEALDTWQGKAVGTDLQT
jgi:radical SAM protein (TIGR01212 family)